MIVNNNSSNIYSMPSYVLSAYILMKFYFLVQRNFPHSYLHILLFVYHIHMSDICICYELRVSPWNSDVEALIITVIVFGGGAFEK